MFVILKSAILAFTGAYMVVNVLSAIPLVAGIVGSVSHARRRRWEQADAEYRKANSKEDTA